MSLQIPTVPTTELNSLKWGKGLLLFFLGGAQI